MNPNNPTDDFLTCLLVVALIAFAYICGLLRGRFVERQSLIASGKWARWFSREQYQAETKR